MDVVIVDAPVGPVDVVVAEVLVVVEGLRHVGS